MAFVILGGGDDTPATVADGDVPAATTDDSDTVTPAPIEILFNAETEASFENFMTNNGFQVDAIDVRAEAQSRCTIMNTATTREEYNALIVEAVENTNQAYDTAGVPDDQRLQSADQERIINAIVVNFCPTVAERLGVTAN